MKKIINPLLLFLALSDCKEKEVPATKTKGPTIVKGRYTIVNTDIPVPDIDVYLSSGGWPSGRELVNETVTDSNGYFEMEIPARFDHGSFDDNYNHTGYLASRQKGGTKNTLNFSNDGGTYIQDFEMIPPAWVNVRIKDVEAKNDYDFMAVGSRYNSITFANSWNMDTVVTMKVFGNMSDTIALGYYKSVPGQGNDIELKIMKFPITVPGFQFKDLLIEY
jgi:hypothetical protein